MNMLKITLFSVALLFLASCDIAVVDEGETKFTAISFHGEINEDAEVVIHKQLDEDNDARRYSVRLEMDGEDDGLPTDSEKETVTHAIPFVVTDAANNERREEVTVTINP